MISLHLDRINPSTVDADQRRKGSGCGTGTSPRDAIEISTMFKQHGTSAFRTQARIGIRTFGGQKSDDARTALALIVRAQSIELALTGDRIEFGPNSSPEKIRASVNGLIREIIDPEDTGITVLPTLRLFIDPSAMNTYYRLRLTNGLPDWPTTTEVLRPTDKLLQTRP